MTKNYKDPIKFYGNPWCPDCHRAKLILTNNEIEFIELDVDTDSDAEAFVVEHNNGFRSVPTIVFPDGAILVEPSSAVLKEKLTEFLPIKPE